MSRITNVIVSIRTAYVEEFEWWPVVNAFWEEGGLVEGSNNCIGIGRFNATREMMLYIESLQKIYYCPLKSNRLVDDSGTRYGYRCVDTLEWDEEALEKGKLVKVRGFPAEHRLKLFRIAVSTQRTEWIVTNDLTQDSSQASRKTCSLRWKIEQFHREAKQLTGLEKCQCQKARIQRNHIACAILVWVRLAEVARAAGSTLYQIKYGLLDDFLRRQLKKPSIRMRLA